MAPAQASLLAKLDTQERVRDFLTNAVASGRDDVVLDGVATATLCLTTPLAAPAAFAVTAGLGIDEHVARFEAEHDDYRAIMLKALCDRLAEAFTELMHAKVRRELWAHAADEVLTVDEMTYEKYAGIRPAPGYPACPDHTAKGDLFRLLDVPPAEQERKRREFTESWPYAPHLLRLLEEQVLIATDAQETRDMIRILANLYKSRGEVTPVLTAADFRLDDDASGIGALLDSVSNEHHRTLRAKAQQNIISVTEAVSNHASLAPHLQEIVGALWLRSIAVGNSAGAEPATLQYAGRDRFGRPPWLSAGAARAWRQMRAVALRADIVLDAISGYRSQWSSNHRFSGNGPSGSIYLLRCACCCCIFSDSQNAGWIKSFEIL